MPLPDTQDIYKPILETLRDEAPHNLAINDLIDITAKYFGLGELSAIDRNLFKQRITHAKKEMIQKKFLTNPADNMYIITSAGLNYLNNPEESESESEIKPEAVIPEESEHEEHKEIPDEVPEVIESETESESESDIELEKPESEPEKFEEIAELPELEDVPEIPDDEEVNDESEDIKLEDEPEDLQTEAESEPESKPEETIDEPSEDIVITEDEPEPETESESESALTENMNEEMNMNPSTGIEDAIRIHNEELAGKVLSGISGLSAETFEVFVIDMLSKMGYRAFHNARYTSEETGSNLIHGVIIDDKTGAPIYIHARKLSPNKTIGRADMQDFIDALSDKGGKGVFATTGKFSEQSEVLANDERIMLIDGLRLAGLMISHNFCVKVEKVYEIKDFDAESFKDYKK